MNQHIFRENDIRGLVGIDLTSETVTVLAKAIGTFFVKEGVKTVSLGYDVRESSSFFSGLFIKNLTETGLNVLNLGMVPTPLVYFSQFSEAVEAGVMITGSHNPKEFNGFKLCLNKTTLHGEQIQTIKNIALAEKFCQGSGNVANKDISADYIKFVQESINTGERKLKVVVDAGNGTSGELATSLYGKLGFETVDLFIEPDSNFPNHHPDPVITENMQDAITAIWQNNADLAIVLDGDGDRIGVADEQGNIIWSDDLMIIFSRSILAKEKGKTFIGEVKCSQRLFADIENHGGKAIMSKVGHSLIKTKMKETNAVLAGEMSGHIFFADRYFGFDDAIYAGARLLEILSQTQQPLSTFLSDLPKAINTLEIRIACAEDNKFKIVENLTADFKKTNQVIEIDGARILFENGWGLVRASNTEPMLALRFEAIDFDNLNLIQNIVETKLQTIMKNF